MKTLLLMRHAKSDWDADYGRDHERPLNERGDRSARVIGRVLASEGLIPDLVISSTATRAASTARLAAESGNWGVDPVLESSLYGGGPNEVVDVVKRAPDVARLMLVGHQPTWSLAVRSLTGESVDMKTATVAVIEFPVDQWADVSAGAGNLTRVLQPRDHFDTEVDT